MVAMTTGDMAHNEYSLKAKLFLLESHNPVETSNADTRGLRYGYVSVFSRASDNMLTGWAIAHAVAIFAHPVKCFCPPSKKAAKNEFNPRRAGGLFSVSCWGVGGTQLLGYVETRGKRQSKERQK